MLQQENTENHDKLLQFEAEHDSEVPNHKEDQACCSTLDYPKADYADMLEELPCFIENNEETKHGREQVEDLFFIIQQGYQLLGGEVFSFKHVHGSFSEPKLENHEHVVHKVEATIFIVESQGLEFSYQQEEKECSHDDIISAFLDSLKEEGENHEVPSQLFHTQEQHESKMEDTIIPNEELGFSEQQEEKKSEQGYEINYVDLHVISRGCPIRRLAQLGIHKEESPLVMLTSKHEVDHQNEWDQPIYSPQANNISNQSRWIGEFISIFWGVFYQFVICPFPPHPFLTAHMHDEHCKSLRRGSYFHEPVNGFV